MPIAEQSATKKKSIVKIGMVWVRHISLNAQLLKVLTESKEK